MSSQTMQVESPLLAIPRVVAIVVVELIKYVLHFKLQMPMIYENILHQTQDRKALKFINQFRIMEHTLTDYIINNNPATIIISLGSNLSNPKEIYPIYLPQQQAYMPNITPTDKQVSDLIRSTLRDCVKYNFPSMDTTIGLTNISILVQQRPLLQPTDWPSGILPKQTYLPPLLKKSPISLYLSLPSPPTSSSSSSPPSTSPSPPRSNEEEEDEEMAEVDGEMDRATDTTTTTTRTGVSQEKINEWRWMRKEEIGGEWGLVTCVLSGWR